MSLAVSDRYHPDTASFILTFLCNNRCVQCNQGDMKIGCLKAAEVEHLMKELHQAGILNSHFLGGEVYFNQATRKLFHQSLGYAMDHNMKIVLNSNAVHATSVDTAKKEFSTIRELAESKKYRKPIIFAASSDDLHCKKELGGHVPADNVANLLAALTEGDFNKIIVTIEACEGYQNLEELHQILRHDKKLSVNKLEALSISRAGDLFALSNKATGRSKIFSEMIHPIMPIGYAEFLPGTDRLDVEHFKAKIDPFESKHLVFFPMKDKETEKIIPYASMHFLQVGTRKAVPCVKDGKLLKLPEITAALGEKNQPTRIGPYLAQLSHRRSIKTRDQRH